MFQFINHFLEDFGNFLKSRNVINAGIAFVIAIQINKLFTDIINLIVNPIASKIISQELNQQEVAVAGIDFKTGQLFLTLFNFIIVMLFIYYVFKASEEAPTTLEKFFTSVTHLFGGSKK
jgi:large-conductance mechanosensitive channel